MSSILRMCCDNRYSRMEQEFDGAERLFLQGRTSDVLHVLEKSNGLSTVSCIELMREIIFYVLF